MVVISRIFITRLRSGYFGNMNIGEDTSWLDSYIDRMMHDEKQADATYRRLITNKMFNYLESQVNPIEKEVTVEELLGGQPSHDSARNGPGIIDAASSQTLA